MLQFIIRWYSRLVYQFSAGNKFSLFTGHMSFQIYLLAGNFTNWTGHNFLTDNTLKKITQDVLVRCSVIVSDHNAKLAGHFQNLVGQSPVTDCYFQHCNWTLDFSKIVLDVIHSRRITYCRHTKKKKLDTTNQ